MFKVEFSKRFVVRSTISYLHTELKFKLKHKRKHSENVKIFIVQYRLWWYYNNKIICSSVFYYSCGSLNIVGVRTAALSRYFSAR
jgi:hypothetical protein